MNGDFFSDIERLRLPIEQMAPLAATTAPKKPPVKSRVNGEFLKGPIPLAWLTIAAGLRGKASLAVGLAIWFEAGRKKSGTITLTTAILNRFKVNRKAKYRALDALEAAGLIVVERRPRKNPVVSIVVDGNGGAHQTNNKLLI